MMLVTYKFGDELILSTSQERVKVGMRDVHGVNALRILSGPLEGAELRLTDRELALNGARLVS